MLETAYRRPPPPLALAGPLSNFTQLFDSPKYKPLLQHAKAESLRRIQLTRDNYAEVLSSVTGCYTLAD